MNDNKLAEASLKFSANVMSLVKDLHEKNVPVIPDMLGQSALRIGAEIHMANPAFGNKDMFARFESAVRFAGETEYWLELLRMTKLIDDVTYRSIFDQCGALKVLLITTIKALKEKTLGR